MLQVQLQPRLQQRVKCSPQEFIDTLKLLEQRYQHADYQPLSDCSSLPSGAYYLASVDTQHRSLYNRNG